MAREVPERSDLARSILAADHMYFPGADLQRHTIQSTDAGEQFYDMIQFQYILFTHFGLLSL